MVIVANRCISRIDRLCSIILLCVRRRYVRTAIFIIICERTLSIWYKWFCLYVGTYWALGARLSVVRARPEFLLFSVAVAVSNFFNLRHRSSNSPTSLPVTLTWISATPGLLSSTSFSEASARSANIAKLANEALSGCVAKWARIDVGICLIKVCHITAFPTTAFVPKPAVFCNRRRNLDGMSEPIFSPEMILFTLSGVVRPRRSIRVPLRLSYLCVRKGCRSTSLTSDATSPESAAQVRLYRSSSSVIWCKSNWFPIWLNHNSTSVK